MLILLFINSYKNPSNQAFQSNIFKKEIIIDEGLYRNINQRQKLKKSRLKPRFSPNTQKVDDIGFGQTLINFLLRKKTEVKKKFKSKNFLSSKSFGEDKVPKSKSLGADKSPRSKNLGPDKVPSQISFRPNKVPRSKSFGPDKVPSQIS